MSKDLLVTVGKCEKNWPSVVKIILKFKNIYIFNAPVYVLSSLCMFIFYQLWFIGCGAGL